MGPITTTIPERPKSEPVEFKKKKKENSEPVNKNRSCTGLFYKFLTPVAKFFINPCTQSLQTHAISHLETHPP